MLNHELWVGGSFRRQKGAVAMQLMQLEIEGAALLRPTEIRDGRGSLREVFRRDLWAAAGLPAVEFVQENESRSPMAHTLRGLHFQRAPHAQSKLVRVARGAAFNVGVDLREGSPSYGAHVAVVLDEAEGAQLWLPAGFAHGALTLVADTHILWRMTAHFAPEAAAGLAWDDPDIAIAWPAQPLAISERDAAWPHLKALAQTGL
jgi:dTDP-4-dehydrorhamnose 3,5-epimerase